MSSTQVEELVKGYITDFKTWNDFSHELCDEDDSEEAMEIATQKYREMIINKYCGEGFNHQGIAFGSDSDHDIKTEVIVQTESIDNGYIVKTKNTSESGFVSDYEYHFLPKDDQWQLVNVFYVDQDGRYECL